MNMSIYLKRNAKMKIKNITEKTYAGNFKKHYNVILLVFFLILIVTSAFIQLHIQKYDFDKMSSVLIYYVIGLITVVSFFTVNYQFRLQATLSRLPLSKLEPRNREFQVELIRFIDKGNEGVSKAKIQGEGNEVLFQSVLFILGAYDDIAIGVLSGILYEGLVRKMQGDFMIKIYNHLMPYLKEIALQKKPARYPGFEALMKKWGQQQI